MDAIGSAPLRLIEEESRPVRPNEVPEVGRGYWCSYWKYVYHVLAIEGTQVTVHTPVDGRTWTHHTALDRRDRVMN